MENITGEQLEQLLTSGEAVLVDFFAKWCGPCKQLMPRLTSMADQYPNIKFVSVDVDENTDEAIKLGIRSVPTVMIFKGNDLINRSSGVQPDSFYKDVLNNL